MPYVLIIGLKDRMKEYKVVSVMIVMECIKMIVMPRLSVKVYAGAALSGCLVLDRAHSVMQALALIISQEGKQLAMVVSRL